MSFTGGPASGTGSELESASDGSTADRLPLSARLAPSPPVPPSPAKDVPESDLLLKVWASCLSTSAPPAQSVNCSGMLVRESSGARNLAADHVDQAGTKQQAKYVRNSTGEHEEIRS